MLVRRAVEQVPFIFNDGGLTQRAGAGAARDLVVVHQAAGLTVERVHREAEAREDAFEVAGVCVVPEAILGGAIRHEPANILKDFEPGGAGIRHFTHRKVGWQAGGWSELCVAPFAFIGCGHGGGVNAFEGEGVGEGSLLTEDFVEMV